MQQGIPLCLFPILDGKCGNRENHFISIMYFELFVNIFILIIENKNINKHDLKKWFVVNNLPSITA